MWEDSGSYRFYRKPASTAIENGESSTALDNGVFRDHGSANAAASRTLLSNNKQSPPQAKSLLYSDIQPQTYSSVQYSWHVFNRVSDRSQPAISDRPVGQQTVPYVQTQPKISDPSAGQPTVPYVQTQHTATYPTVGPPTVPCFQAQPAIAYPTVGQLTVPYVSTLPPPAVRLELSTLQTVERHLLELEHYHGKHGNCDVNQSTSAPLYEWIIGVRTGVREPTHEQIKRLNKLELDFSWRKRKRLSDRLQDLTAFQKQHGHLSVPMTYRQHDNLGSWVQDIRRGRIEITPEQYKVRSMHTRSRLEFFVLFAIIRSSIRTAFFGGNALLVMMLGTANGLPLPSFTRQTPLPRSVKV